MRTRTEPNTKKVKHEVEMVVAETLSEYSDEPHIRCPLCGSGFQDKGIAGPTIITHGYLFRPWKWTIVPEYEYWVYECATLYTFEYSPRWEFSPHCAARAIRHMKNLTCFIEA